MALESMRSTGFPIIPGHVDKAEFDKVYCGFREFISMMMREPACIEKLKVIFNVQTSTPESIKSLCQTASTIG
jgi:hypothetical protein